jgi:hypothetical protein
MLTLETEFDADSMHDSSMRELYHSLLTQEMARLLIPENDHLLDRGKWQKADRKP